MAWTIKYAESAFKQLAKLHRPDAKRIVGFLRDRISVTHNPRTLGSALRGTDLGGYWKYRVGDFRLIVDIRDHEVVVLVLKIGNRRDVYR